MEYMIRIVLMTSSVMLCQEFKTSEEIIENVSNRMDVILVATQQAIHKATDLVMQNSYHQADGDKIVADEDYDVYREVNRLLACPTWREMQEKAQSDFWYSSLWHDDSSNGNVETLFRNVQVTRNSVDRLVMNGSRNFTAKCDFLTHEQLFTCLTVASEEISAISHRLLDELHNNLRNLRQSLCNKSIELG